MSSPAPSSAPSASGRSPDVATSGDVFVFPASFGQQQLWFVDQYNPGSTAYSLPILLRAAGKLDPALLERVINEIVRRHEILRTTFSLRRWELVQVISPAAGRALPLTDLSSVPESEREKRAFTEAGEEIRRPFDLRHGPLLRARLWKLSDRDHLFLINMHHIVADGCSFALLLREVSLLYEAFEQGRPSPLPELLLQYADFAQWQRARAAEGGLEEHLSFWKTALAGAPPVLDLRTDRPRPPRQTFPGAYETELLSPGLSARIKTLSRREGVTPFMTFLAAFFALLYRHTGQTDLIVGSPIANRTRIELEPLIGMFMNTLVLRADLSGNPTFRDLLARVGRVCVDAYAHQEMPFEKLVEEVKPHRDPSRNPLFQVMFVHQQAVVAPFQAGELRFAPVEADRAGSLTDLSLFVTEGEGTLTAGIEHNTDLFDASTIRRMLGHLGTLLSAAVENPALRLDEIPLLTQEERRQLLVEWNDTSSDFPKDKCLHQLFEEQVERTPEATALLFEGSRLSYRQLNARSNRLAHLLARLNVGPESRVVICMERSVEMVVGLMAILKAGGAYVPIDPTYPRERLAFLLEDAAPSVVLTQARLAETVSFPGSVLSLDSNGLRLGAESEQNPKSGVGPENLAYLIYTSGSTGRPKGAMIPHRGVVNYLAWCLEAYGVASGGGAPVQSSLSFDLTVTSLFAPLLCGRTVHLLRERPAGAALAALFHDSKEWSLVKTTPTELRLLSDQISPDRAPGRTRALVVGGESLTPESVGFWRAHAPGTAIFNEYGPTETVVGCCVYEVPEGPLRGPVPIGRPIANTRIYVLGADGEPTPIGVVGELCISGAGVARGYRNLPELTAERFVPDPFGEPGSRMYRSGDYARYLPDGNIEYVGRRDAQVKLRGYRIELEEIEAALSQHPRVRRCAVLAREDTPGEKRLVAYADVGAAAGVEESELRAFLKERLPAHMVPSVFRIQEELPRTPNGKIDRQALPAPAPITLEKEPGRVAPRDDVETRLAAIWEEVLDVRAVGVHDDYFDLGGHSLLAVKLFARIGDEFGRQLPLATIFDAPTIDRLAAVLRREGWSPAWSSLVAIQPKGSRPPFYCVHAVGGNVLTYADLARHLGSEQPVYGLQARGLDGKETPHERIEDMAAYYVKEILKFQPAGPYFLGGSSGGGMVAFEMAQQLRHQGHTVGVLALFDTWGPDYQPLPGMTALRRSLMGFVDRLDLHAGNLIAARGADAKLAYLAIKSQRLARRYPKKLEQLFGNPLPNVLRRIESASLAAVNQYVPQPYPGRLTLFRATKQPAGYPDDRRLGWCRIAQGGVDVYDVPGYHGAIVYEPRVQVLAERLRVCLADALRPESDGAGEPRAERR